MQIGRRGLALYFVRRAINHYRDHVASRQHGIQLDFAPIEPALPNLAIARQFQAAALAVDDHVVRHCRASSLAARFQPEGGCTACLPLPFTETPLLDTVCGSSAANRPAAIAAMSACSFFTESASAVASSRSRKPVSRRPARKSGSRRIRRNREM